MAFKDRRRTDIRDDLQRTPMWRTSAAISVADTGAGTVVFDSFPRDGSIYVIDCCILDVLTDLNAGTVNIGHGTLPTDETAESGTLTTTDADSMWPTATGDETSGTITSMFDMTAAALVLYGAVTTVPVLIATIATAASGIFRVHYRIAEIQAYK